MTSGSTNPSEEFVQRHQAIGDLYKVDFTTLDEAFQDVTATAAQTLHSDSASIWLFANESHTTCLVREWHHEGYGERQADKCVLTLAATDAYLLKLQSDPLVVLDSSDDYGQASGDLADYLRENSIQSLIAVPVCAGGAVVGVLCHENRTRRQWSGADRALAIRLGDIVALAIESDRRRCANALGARFRRLVEETPDNIGLGDASGRIEYLNPKGRRLLGLAPDEPVQMYRFADFLAPESRAFILERADATARREGNWSGDVFLRSRRGQEFEANMTLTMYRGKAGHIEYVSCVVRDVSSQAILERKLADTEGRYEAFLAQSSDALFLVDVATGRLMQVSPALKRLLGYDEAEFEHLTIFDLVKDTPENIRRNLDESVELGHLVLGERQYRHKQGHFIDLEISALLCIDQALPTLSVRVRDISERLQRRRDIERLAYYDPLTGLANSNLLRERGEALLADSLAGETPISFVIVQIDRWQRFSDTLGYQIAESLLQQVGKRLQHAIDGKNILVARLLEGAEFGLLFKTGEQDDRALVERIQKSFVTPFRAERETVHLVMRGGIARFPTHAVNFKDLTKRAGLALRNAHLRNLVYCVYGPAQSGRLHDERLLEEDLRQAIGTQQIQLRYQPIICPGRGGRVMSVGALVRWGHPQEGLLPPSDFIALAEDSHLILELDRSILLKATRAAAPWLRTTPNVVLSVNLSVLTLMNPQLIGILRQALKNSKLVPEQLCMEITETAIMHDRRTAADMLRQISALGVSIALDDFGTGYSSLAYLKDLTIDVLKIDRDFTRGIGMDVRDERAIETIISLGHDLNMQVVAEGVETQAQLEWLSARKIDRLQGFYLGMPLTLSELRKSYAAREAGGAH